MPFECREFGTGDRHHRLPRQRQDHGAEPVCCAHPVLADTAVIINEFGEVSLDHLLIEQAIENAVLLKNGCICCTVSGDILDTLETCCGGGTPVSCRRSAASRSRPPASPIRPRSRTR